MSFNKCPLRICITRICALYQMGLAATQTIKPVHSGWPPVVREFPASFGSYRKNSKNWDTLNYHRDCPTNGIVAFYSAILRSKDSDRITNRVDTDQTAP